jgi:hypothetical protein
MQSSRGCSSLCASSSKTERSPNGLAVPPRQPYFAAMSWFPRPSSPIAAFRDLAAFLRHRSREQVIGASLALLVTMIIVIEFVVDSKMGTAPPPQVIYVDSWSANRTDAEIIADQKKDEAAKEAAAKERQRQFQKLENRFGL